MSNILNHNRNIFDFKLNKSDYWDFHIHLGGAGNWNGRGDDGNCLSAYIDVNDNDCVWFGKLCSKAANTWHESVNDGLELGNIGFTGVDNGLITYEKDKITNKEFLDIFLGSAYTVEKDDKRLILNKVGGNNQLYSYEADITYEDGVQVARLNGGFYQGFFKSGNYQTLPDDFNKGITLSFVLKKEDFGNNGFTLNEKHPGNKGIFFYVGTRAENKWWEKYTTDIGYEECLQGYASDYSEGYLHEEAMNNDSYIREEEHEKSGEYFDGNYVEKNKEDKYFDENANCCDFYVKDDYYEEDVAIDENLKLKTSEGYDLYQPNITEFKTDNKFITYDRTEDGLTVEKDDGNTEVVIHDVKTPGMPNYFLLFNRACGGYTAENIQSLIDKESKKYNVLADIYNNAMAFRITDKGEIGYRYLVKDCESDTTYRIEEEYSDEGVVKDKEWASVDVRILPFNSGIRIMFYVDARLVMVSKELPKLKLRELDDLASKQEGVPYNISIGGGTQGLCDRVDVNYMVPPTEILPLEKNFAGSFVGYVKSFKFYSCLVNFSFLKQNKAEMEILRR